MFIKNWLQTESLSAKATRKFLRDRFGMAGLFVVFVYFVIALGVWMNWWAGSWDELLGNSLESTSWQYWFGTNRNGQDIFQRVLFGTKTAFEVGLVVSILSITIGALLGGVAGFFSGTFIDEIIIWMYGCIDAIPFYLFVAAVAVALNGSPYGMHIAMISTFWSGTCRIVRGEVIKIKHLEYVEAARAIGLRRTKIILKHIMPNTVHILLVQLTIYFVSAIKSEVILSYLGLGVKDGTSWGLMIAESTSEVVGGFFNNFLAASMFLFVLVMGFNFFADALQDALDPKKVSG